MGATGWILVAVASVALFIFLVWPFIISAWRDWRKRRG